MRREVSEEGKNRFEDEGMGWGGGERRRKRRASKLPFLIKYTCIHVAIDKTLEISFTKMFSHGGWD